MTSNNLHISNMKTQSIIVKASIEIDRKSGKKKIVCLHFADNEIRQLTDKDFIKR
jgi:hypothetical protein